MRRLPRVLVPCVLLVLLAASPSPAKICAYDNVPAATLLLPYFEVDLQNPNGRTTLFAVVNASAEAHLAHVVLWTDLGVPTANFDIYLTGYGVQTVNLRDIFAGRLPQTADAAHDPNDTISPMGRFSHEANFPGCDSLPPAPLSGVFLDHLRTSHTGKGSPLYANLCSGQNIGDGVARGYATIDVARRCSYLFPGVEGYFGADGVAGMENVLLGDFVYLDGDRNQSDGNTLVALEADPARHGNGQPTFYGRYATDGADGREPLPSRWGTRYLLGGAFSGGTDLIAWRDVGGAPTDPFPCGHPPSWYPTLQVQYEVFDEQEHPVLPQVFPILPPPQIIPVLFPAAAGRTLVGGSNLPVPYRFGWLFLDLKSLESRSPATQAWVGTIHRAAGRFSVGLSAVALGSGCEPDVSVVGR